jgi:hypothetical protein
VNTGPAPTVSMMPLVEENRALIAEVRALKEMLGRQAVQIDALLEAGQPFSLRQRLVPIEARLSPVEMYGTGGRPLGLIQQRLFAALDLNKVLVRAAPLDLDTTYRMFVLSTGREGMPP